MSIIKIPDELAREIDRLAGAKETLRLRHRCVMEIRSERDGRFEDALNQRQR